MKTLQELSDRLEIQDKITAYAYAVDFHRWDELDAIFTADAHLDFTASGGEKGDLATIKTFFDRALNMFEGHQHLMGNTTVTIEGDSATSQTLCHNPMYLTGDDGEQRVLFVGIWYHDTWVRGADGWRISRRVQQKGYLHGL
ncbi:MAG: nuclear transport factor 2 family protein [Actinomycetota bacterium]|nr:nuclear transport factor 2 family protein [Actinomycetota bacterium]